MTAFHNLSREQRHRAADRLTDLWQLEERLAWQLDAWMLRHARALPHYDAAAAADLRRRSARVRRALKQAILGLGRPTLRLPVVLNRVDEQGATRMLQRIYSDNRAALQQARLATLHADATADHEAALVFEELTTCLTARREFLRSLSAPVHTLASQASTHYQPTAA